MEPEIRVIFLMSVIITFNLYSIINLICFIEPSIRSLLVPEGFAIKILTPFLLLIFNYFRFAYKAKFKTILDEYRNENKSHKTFGLILLWVYVAFSGWLFAITIGILNSNRPGPF